MAITSLTLPCSSKNLGLSGMLIIANKQPKGKRLLKHRNSLHGLKTKIPLNSEILKPHLIKPKLNKGCNNIAIATNTVTFDRYLNRFSSDVNSLK